MKIQNIHIIINPASGVGEPILPVINASMKEFSIKWEAFITHHAGDAAQFARNAVHEKVDALAVYGGDGTLAEAVSGLIGSELPLIILPGGSANVMATELGIPIDLKEACALLGPGASETKTIDVGQFKKRYFIVGISLGFESDIVKGAKREIKNKIGVFAYLLSAFAALRKIKKTVYHLNIDGQKHDVQGLTCVITNTGHIGFSNISFDQRIDVSDGFLDVLVVQKEKISLFKLIVKLVVVDLLKWEHPENLELVAHWRGKDIHVFSSPKQTIQCDGEVLENAHLHIKIIPGAIKVVVKKM